MMKQNNICKQIKDNIILLIEQGKLDEAEKLLVQYIEIYPKDGDVYSIYSNILVGKKMYNEAERVLLSGIVYEEDSVDLLFNLATVLELKGETEQARDLYEVVLQKTEDYTINQFASEAVERLLKNNAAGSQESKEAFGKSSEMLVAVLRRKGILIEIENYYPSNLQNNDDSMRVYLVMGHKQDELEKVARRFCIQRIVSNNVF